MANFKIYTLNEKALWSKYLNKLPLDKQDVYFTPEYYSLYENNDDGEANCFIYEKDGNIAIYPFLKNSINKLGYSLNDEYYDIQGAYGYNGMLSSTENKAFLADFWKTFDQFCKDNNIVAEFTRFHPMLENQKLSMQHMQVLFDRETVVLDLTMDYETIWLNEYSSKNRNMIRKASKEGFISDIIESPTSYQINAFFDIYTYSMKKAEADNYYFFKRSYFFNLFSLLKNNIILLNVTDKNKNLVCSSIFFSYGDYFHYHLSGRSKEANNSVNNFLLDEAVRYAQKKGAKTFHFGGGRSSMPDDSLLKFKGSFAKNRLQFNIGKHIHNKQVYDEVVRQWETKFPEKKEKYNNLLLKYRY